MRLLGNRWVVAAAIALVALALYLPAIGVGDFVGDDEALDAGVVWEMRRSGDWLFPEFNGEYLPPKPPLFYWAAAAVSKLHGRVDEWSVRAPSAFAAAAMVGVGVAGSATTIGLGPAALGGLMLATTPIVFGAARSGRCDMLLALVVTGCLLLVAASRSGPMSRGARWSFWSLLGLAALIKGGAGVGLVVVVIVAAAALERNRRLLTGLLDASIVAFLVIGGAWYVIATAHWGYRFVDEQIVGENLHHLFGGSGISDKGSGTTPLAEHLTYYLLHFFPHTAPWGLLVPLALLGVWRREPQTDRLRFFAVWLLAGLAFFTMVSRKSPYYLLPLAPPAALLAGAWIHGRVRDSLASEAPRVGFSLRTFAVLIGVSTLAWLVSINVTGGSCELRAAARGLAERPLATIAAGALLGACALGAVKALRGRNWGTGITAVLGGLIALFTLAGSITGRLDDCASLRAFAGQVRASTTPEDRVLFFQAPLPAVVLYAERTIPTLRDPRAAPRHAFYLIVPEAFDRALPPEWQSRAETIASARGRVFTRKRMGIRLLRITPPASGDESDDVPLGGVSGTQEARNP